MIGITGASGYLGQRISLLLIQRGYDVLSLSSGAADAGSGVEMRFPEMTPTLNLDLSDIASIQAAKPELAKLSAIVHLAEFVPDATERLEFNDIKRTIDENVMNTVRLLQVIADSEALKLFLFASSAEVYGTADDPVMEDHVTEPTTYYGASKLTAEKYVSLFSEDTGIACCSLRFAELYGPAARLTGTVGSLLSGANSRKKMSVSGDGSTRHDLLFVEDAAEAIVACLENAPPAILNLGSGKHWTTDEIATTIMKLLPGVTVESESEPSEGDAPKVHPIPGPLLKNDLACSVLKWTPTTTLEQGLSAQLEWMSRDPSLQRS